MSDGVVSRDRLIALLRERGHALDDSQVGTDVSPPRDQYVTIAVTPDPTLKSGYRDRFFATYVDRACRPVLRTSPDFAIPEPFASLVTQEPIGGDEWQGNFWLGPFRWLLCRLAHAPGLMIWPDGRCWPDKSHPFLNDQEFAWTPALQRRLTAARDTESTAGALLLDLSDPTDCMVLMEAARQVEGNCYDYYVSDPAASAVYQLHHHDKIVASIPDPLELRRLVEELSSRTDLFNDCSGYIDDWDDEDDGPPADD